MVTEVTHSEEGPQVGSGTQEPPRSLRAAPLLQLTYRYVPSPRRSLPDYRSSSTIGAGVRGQAAVIGCEKQGNSHPRLHLSEAADVHTGCASDLSTYRPHMLQHSPLGQWSWDREREKQILKGKGVSLSLTPGAASLATWLLDLTLTLTLTSQ